MYAAAFLVGTVFGLPFLLGDLGLLFGDPFEALKAGGYTSLIVLGVLATVSEQGRPRQSVVYFVREGDRIRMYDIKTHYCEEVRRSCESYAAQLNVYAYVWRELRGSNVHEMGIIAIQLPERLRDALRKGDHECVAAEPDGWDPVVPIPSDPASLDEVFRAIAETVDKIEDGVFAPPPPAILAGTKALDENIGGRRTAFATLHCRNCDGRFSCDSYREYARTTSKLGKQFDVLSYVAEAKDDGELDAWIDENLGDNDGDEEEA